ncbi:MAG: hypothetical protein KC912_18910 [Proteobacteria bacterium]|nr:hypothetical protein [Pseudomonadota bacterium]
MSRTLVFAALFVAAGCSPKPFQIERWEHAELGDEASREVDSYECMKENTSFKRRSSAGSGGYSASAGDEVDVQLYSACMKARGYAMVDRTPDSMVALNQYVTAAPEPGTVAVEATFGHGGGFVNDTALYAEGEGGRRPFYRNRVDLRETSSAMRLGLGAAYRPSRLVEFGLSAEARRVLTFGQLYAGQLTVPDIHLKDQWAPYATVYGRLRLPMMPRLSALGGLGAGHIPSFEVPSYTVTGMMTGEDGSEVPFEQFVSSVRRDGSMDVYLRLGVGYDVLLAKPHGVRVGCALERPFTELGWLRADCSVAYRFSPKGR